MSKKPIVAVDFTKIIRDPFFDRYICFIFGDQKYAVKEFKRHYDLEVEEDNNIGSVTPVTQKTTGARQYVLHIDNSNWNYTIFNYSIIVHEVFHLAFCIQKDIGGFGDSFKLGDDLQEHTAYLMEKLFGLILKEITKKVKYK